MDRSERFGAYEQDMGSRQSDYYRQRLEREHQESEKSGMQWPMIAAGAVMLGVGSYLLFRGFQGESEGQEFGRIRDRGARALDRTRSRMGDMARRMPGIEVREQITIDKPVSELYRFWRDVENLPRVMSYLESVTRQNDRKSHWVAKGPAGQSVEWDAEVTDARENELMAWRSLEGSEIPNEGSVRFSRSPDGRGTVVDVAVTYHPPGGKAGATVAKLFGREPAQEIRKDLQNFKERVESGNLILGTSSAGGSRS